MSDKAAVRTEARTRTVPGRAVQPGDHHGRPRLRRRPAGPVGPDGQMVQAASASRPSRSCATSPPSSTRPVAASIASSRRRSSSPTSANFAGMNEVYARHVGETPPARSTVEVSALPSGALSRSRRSRRADPRGAGRLRGTRRGRRTRAGVGAGRAPDAVREPDEVFRYGSRGPDRERLALRRHRRHEPQHERAGAGRVGRLPPIGRRREAARGEQHDGRGGGTGGCDEREKGTELHALESLTGALTARSPRPHVSTRTRRKPHKI